MNESCKKCMEGAPYRWCCAKECGEHEFCRNCEIPQYECCHEVSSPITDKTDEKDLIPIEKVLEVCIVILLEFL